MKTRIEVKVTGVTAQTLGSEWATVDLPNGFGIRYFKSLSGLNDLNEIELDTAVAFSLDLTPQNQVIFARFASMSVIDNNTAYLECRVWEGAHQKPFDRMYFRGRRGGSMDFEFRRSEKHWAVLANELKLTEIVLPEKTLDEANYIADSENPIWSNPLDPVRWIPCDYGGWVDLATPPQFTDPPVKSVWVEDLRPWVSIPHLLYEGFCKIGWTIKGLILEQPEIRSQYAYLLAENYYVNSDGGDCKLVLESSVDYDQTTPTSFIPYFAANTVVYDPGGNVMPTVLGLRMPAYTNPLPYKAAHEWAFSGSIQNTTGIAAPIYYGVLELLPSTGGIDAVLTSIVDPVEYGEPLAPGETRFVQFKIEGSLEVGQMGCLVVGGGFIIKKGFRVTIQPAQKSLIRGDVVRPNEMFNADYTLLQLFKGFVHMINGKFRVNEITREIEIMPETTTTINGVTIPGYYDSANEPEDITLSVVPGSVNFEPIRAKAKQYTRYAFKDSTDAGVRAVSDDYRPHSRTILNGLELEAGTTEITNPFFEPTIDRQSTVLKKQAGSVSPYYPALLDNTDGNRSFSIGPRAVIFHGQTKQFIESGGAFFAAWNYFEGTATDVLSVATQAPNFIFGVGSNAPPLPDATLVYGVKPSDLFVRFRLATSQRQRHGYVCDLLQRLTIEQFSGYDFSKQRIVRHDGFPVTLFPTNIDDFTPASGTATPLTFYAELQQSGCCDLPCNCVFTQCDYYQDLGTYITQTQLDALRVSSFKVDGKEYITTPIFLGLYKAIEVDKKAFVTNLVDALRKAAVPYFTYNYSRQTYAPKNDLRFFTIKRPACQSFTIEVSNASEVVYRYTESLMEQKVFGGTFGPFGYGGSPVSVPNNCITTQEY